MHLHGVGQAEWQNQEAQNQVTLIIKTTFLFQLQSLFIVVVLFFLFFLVCWHFYIFRVLYCFPVLLSDIFFEFPFLFRWIAFCQRVTLNN